MLGVRYLVVEATEPIEGEEVYYLCLNYGNPRIGRAVTPDGGKRLIDAFCVKFGGDYRREFMSNESVRGEFARANPGWVVTHCYQIAEDRFAVGYWDGAYFYSGIYTRDEDGFRPMGDRTIAGARIRLPKECDASPAAK